MFSFLKSLSNNNFILIHSITNHLFLSVFLCRYVEHNITIIMVRLYVKWFNVKWKRVWRLKEYLKWGRNMLFFYMFDTPKLNFEFQEAFLFRECDVIVVGSGVAFRATGGATPSTPFPLALTLTLTSLPSLSHSICSLSPSPFPSLSCASHLALISLALITKVDDQVGQRHWPTFASCERVCSVCECVCV